MLVVVAVPHGVSHHLLSPHRTDFLITCLFPIIPAPRGVPHHLLTSRHPGAARSFTSNAYFPFSSDLDESNTFYDFTEWLETVLRDLGCSWLQRWSTRATLAAETVLGDLGCSWLQRWSTWATLAFCDLMYDFTGWPETVLGDLSCSRLQRWSTRATLAAETILGDLGCSWLQRWSMRATLAIYTYLYHYADDYLYVRLGLCKPLNQNQLPTRRGGATNGQPDSGRFPAI